MKIIVQKFGGTSVAGLERMQTIRRKVLRALEKGYKALVVLSAMSGETNRLIDLGRQFSRHPSPAEMDVLMTTGEQVSVALFAMLLHDAGVKARSLLGHQAEVITDCMFGKARIMSINSQKLRKMLLEYDALVVAGFQGCDEQGRLTTLGRGGSDTSAVALAAAVKADVCEIYTDVNGVYTTDPNVCSKARKMDKISYDEMLEFASMGAKVLQIRSVEFAKKYGVNVHVRSSFGDEEGTYVTQEDASMEAVLVSGVAYDKDQARITVTDVQDRPGVAAALFSPLADAGIVVDMIIQNTSRHGTTDMTFTVPRNELEQTLDILGGLKDQLGAGQIVADKGVSKVSVIGVGMRNHSGVASRMFQALRDENINILMISTSEIKVACLIEEKYTELAVRALHDKFGLENGPAKA